MKFKTKFLLFSSTIVLGATTLVTTISCINVRSSRNANNLFSSPNTGVSLLYDVGLVAAPVNTLNYIRQKNVAVVIPSLIEGFLKDGPNNDVKNLLGLPVIHGAIQSIPVDNLDDYVIPGRNAQLSLGGTVFPLDSFQTTTGVAAPSLTNEPTMFSLTTPSNNVFSTKIKLNEGQSIWSNGDKVTPQDFIDSAQYILDINTGSQLIIDFLNLNIKNSQKILDAQRNYIKVHKRAYLDPFGRKKVVNGKQVELEFWEQGIWESQNPNDSVELQMIVDAVKGLGIYTGNFGPINVNAIPSTPNEVAEFLKKPLNRYADPRQVWQFQGSNIIGGHRIWAQNEWEIRYEFEANSPVQYFTFFEGIKGQVLKPVNRKFIEGIGGIHFFGNSKANFIWNGAYDPVEILLSDQGYILLNKRKEYYSSGRTLVNVIKIFFQTQQAVTASLFEDGYISQTNIPTSFIYKFWSNLKTRALMAKKVGYGTMALQLNLDKETNTSKALLDQDFRNALWYASDRKTALNLVGWDTSFPVATWTAFGQAKTSKGIPLEAWFDDINVTTKFGNKIPLQTYNYEDHLAKSFTFENVLRDDNNFDLQTARYYMKLYRDKNPNVSKVKLRFLYDSSEPQLNAGIAITDLYKKAFNGFVEVEIKGVPSNVFEDDRPEGKFDLVFTNFDNFGREYDSYIKAFFYPDEVSSENGKRQGFRLNPSGSWTYHTYFEELRASNTLESTRTRLEISEQEWNKIQELSVIKVGETDQQFYDRVSRFFSFLFSDLEQANGWTEHRVYRLVASYEKIIKDAAPVIPLMEIDTNWEISRLGGVGSTHTYDLQYAYDLNFPPRAGLPSTRKV